MCRRRFFKSYFYINYNEESHGVLINYGGPAHGETFSVSPFVAGGGSDTIELVSARPWTILKGEGMDWLNVECEEASVIDTRKNSGTYQITLSAEENSEYSERSGSLTAKTLNDRFSIVISVSQEPQADVKYITVVPQTVNMGAEEAFNRLVCYFHYNGVRSEVVPSWSTNNTAATVASDGVINSNNTGASPVTVTATATYVHEGDTLTDTSQIHVAAAVIERYITVSPQSASIGATGTQQLTVTYHEVINGHETTTDVTSSANIGYSSNNPVIGVNGTGLVTANNQGGDTETATISITYPGTTGTTATITAASASVELKNLRVSPTTMYLDSGHSVTGKSIQAFVDEYVNGSLSRTIEVTSAATWDTVNSNGTQAHDIAVCFTGSNHTEFVKPVYDPAEFYPSNRKVSAVTSYAGSAATCDVTVGPEGRIYYELAVSPTEATISSTGTLQLTSTLIAYVDGVHDPSRDRDVTISSTYVITSTTVQGLIKNPGSDGVIEGNGLDQGGDVVVRVTNNAAENYVDVTIHVSPATVEYRNLTVSPTAMTLNTAHTTNGVEIHAYVDVYVNGTKTGTEEVTLENTLTWSSNDTSVATVSKSGNKEVVKSVYGSGYFPNNRYATVTASYLGSAATCDVTVEAEGYISWGDFRYASGVLFTNFYDITEVNLSSAQSKSDVFVIESKYVDGVYVDDSDETPHAEFTLYSGGTTLASFECGFTSRTVFNSTQLKIDYTVDCGFTFTSQNDEEKEQRYTLRAVDVQKNMTTNLTIKIAAHEHVPVVTYVDIFFASGNSSNPISYLQMASSATKNKIFVFEEKDIDGSFDSYINDTTNASYTLYSGDTVLTSFTCTNTGTKYSDANITIKYTGSTNGIVIESSNSDENNAKYYTLEVSDDGNVAGLDIEIASAEPHVPVTAYTNIFYISANTGTVIDSLSLASAETKNKVFVYETRTVDGQFDGYVNDTTNASYELYSGSTKLTAFTCNSTGTKYSDANIIIKYTGTTNGIVFESTNSDTSNAKYYTLTVSDDGNSADLDITIARAADVYEYREVFFISGTSSPSSSYDEIQTVNVLATGSMDHIFLYQNEYLNGSFYAVVNDTNGGNVEYTLYSGSTAITTFTCTANGTKYNGSDIMISYTSSGGIEITGKNVAEIGKTYTLKGQDGTYSDTITINIGGALIEYGNLYFVSGANQYDLDEVNLGSAETKTRVNVYADKYVNGTLVGQVNFNEMAIYTVYSGGQQIATFNATDPSPVFADSSLRITYDSTNGFTLIADNQENRTQVYTINAYYDTHDDDLQITVAPAYQPIPTYTVTFYTRDCDADQTITADTLSYKINNGSWTSVGGTKTGFTVTVEQGSVVYYQGTKSGYINVSGQETINAGTNRNICFESEKAELTFENYNIVVNNECDRNIIVPYLDLTIRIGNTDYGLVYNNEAGQTPIPPGHSAWLLLDQTTKPPTSVLSPSQLEPRVIIINPHVTDEYGSVFSLEPGTDDYAQLVLENSVGDEESIDMSYSTIAYQGDYPFGTIPVGEEGHILYDNAEFNIKHTFNP